MSRPPYLTRPHWRHLTDPSVPVPAVTRSYVVTKGSNVRCIMPSGVKDPNDPACILKKSESNDTLTQPAQPNLLYDKINQARVLWGRWVGDVQRTWWVVGLCGIMLALLFGLIYLMLLRCVPAARACTRACICGQAASAALVPSA